MVLIGLLVIALICLVLGLVLPSSAWLIASLIASAGAGYLLWKLRNSVGSAGSVGRAATASTHTGVPATAAANGAGPAPVDSAAGSDGDADSVEVPAEAPVQDDGQVWVIDGRPRYHLADCAIIQGQDAEPIPFEQATEDGFMPCSLCEPNVVRAR